MTHWGSIADSAQAAEYIRSIRRTETHESQANTFYETCLALIQKVESFKETLRDVCSDVTMR